MASAARPMASFAKSTMQLTPSRVASRALSTATRQSINATPLRCISRPSPVMRLATTGRVAFRRAYSDEAPKPKPGRLRRTFRWAWRLTYLSVLGLVGYTGYVIYDDRHPNPQFEQDPTKKTIVVLGKFCARATNSFLQISAAPSSAMRALQRCANQKHHC